jgi:HAE1 family hydrophobic/amphiphilic exporter-1
LNFQPPAVPGYGAAGGFELRLLDKAGSMIKKMETNTDFVKDGTNDQN